MYLVELRPGKEELYRSGDDLAAAIRRGDVDAHSRIYHRATSKWISVTLHPQFKAIIAEKSAAPLPPMERSNWTYLTAQAETLEASEAGRDDITTGSGEVPSATRTHPWRRIFGLGVAGVALVLGIQLASSGPRPPWSRASAAPQVEAEQAGISPEASEEAGQVVSLASNAATWQPPAPAAEAKPARAEVARPDLPRAPKLRVKTLGDALPADAAASATDAGTVEGLLARYGRAYADARERLGTGMRVARLDQLFAPARLAPDGGLTDTRLGLAGVANFIRVYRQQETVIEREYQDSFTVLSKQNKWSSRAVRRWYSRAPEREPAAIASLTSRIVATLDTVLGVLDEQAGAYRLGDGTIAFEDKAAQHRYSALRRQVTDLIEAARAAGGDETPGPMGHLLQAVGTTRLPREI
jgi:hypothetical protein